MCRYKKKKCSGLCARVCKRSIDRFRCISPDADLGTEVVGMGKTSISQDCRSSASPPETGEADRLAAYVIEDPLTKKTIPINTNQHISAWFSFPQCQRSKQKLSALSWGERD